MSDDETPDATPETPDAPTPALTRPDGSPRRIRQDGQPDRRHDATGRPRIWTLEELRPVPELMEREGLSLRQACKALGIPHARFLQALPSLPELGERYAKVRPHVAAEYARRSVRAVEKAWDIVTDPQSDAKRGNAIAAAGRNLSDRYAWVAGRIDPDAFGDRVKHEGTVKVEAVVLLPPLQPVPLPPAPTITATLLPAAEGDATPET